MMKSLKQKHLMFIVGIPATFLPPPHKMKKEKLVKCVKFYNYPQQPTPTAATAATAAAT
jgi:hypothetical protein